MATIQSLTAMSGAARGMGSRYEDILQVFKENEEVEKSMGQTIGSVKENLFNRRESFMQKAVQEKDNVRTAGDFSLSYFMELAAALVKLVMATINLNAGAAASATATLALKGKNFNISYHNMFKYYEVLWVNEAEATRLDHEEQALDMVTSQLRRDPNNLALPAFSSAVIAK